MAEQTGLSYQQVRIIQQQVLYDALNEPEAHRLRQQILRETMHREALCMIYQKVYQEHYTDNRAQDPHRKRRILRALATLAIRIGWALQQFGQAHLEKQQASDAPGSAS